MWSGACLDDHDTFTQAVALRCEQPAAPRDRNKVHPEACFPVWWDPVLTVSVPESKRPGKGWTRPNCRTTGIKAWWRSERSWMNLSSAGQVRMQEN